MRLLPIATIVDCLRAFADGEGTVVEYSEPYLIVAVRGWEIVVFDDAGELDYLEHATAPDDTAYHYDDLNFKDNSGVEMLLTDAERDKFMQRVRPEDKPPPHSATRRML